MSQESAETSCNEKTECGNITYAIDCITKEEYEKLLLNIHKFIDTRLENSIKNIYEKYSLSSYQNILDQETYNRYLKRLQEMQSNANEMQKAMINFIINDPKKHHETIRLFLKTPPKQNIMATLFLAITYTRQKQFSDAIDILEQSDLEDSYIFVYKGIIQHNSHKNSRDNIEQYLIKNGSDKNNLNNAILLRLLKKDKLALKYLNLIYCQNLNNNDLYLLLVSYSISYFKLNQDKEALAVLSQALELDVDTFEAERMQAICWARSTDNKTKAIKLFTTLQNRCPIDNDINRNVAISYANRYVNAPKKDQTQEEYEKVLNAFHLSRQNNPFHAPNYFDLATFYYNTGRFDKSLKNYAKAIECAPYKFKYYSSYAKAFCHSRHLISSDDISTLENIITPMLTKEKTTTDVSSYLELIEIQAKCLVHQYLKNAKTFDKVSDEIKTLIISVKSLFSNDKCNELEKKHYSKLYEVNSLLNNYLDDLNKINLKNVNIITINKLVDTKLTTNETCLFRGMNRASWNMKPNVFRDPNNDSHSIMLENFKREAIGVSDKNYDHYTRIDWLGLMQHHGSLTELLDWTQSFSIALFFAIHLDNKSDTNQYGIPCIYTLTYQKVLSNQEIEDLVNHDYNKNHIDHITTNGSKNESQNIVVFAPKISHRRADIQKSMFTYHRSAIDIDQVPGLTMKRYVISPLLIPVIIKTLEKDHINVATVYPDLQNLSKRLRDTKNINNLKFT